MNRSRILTVATLLAAAAVLGACAPLEFGPSQATAPAVRPEDAERLDQEHQQAIEGQAWADSVRQRYDEAREIDGDEDYAALLRERQLLTWGARRVGHLDISVNGPDTVRRGELDALAAKVLNRLDRSVRSVTLNVLGGESTGYASRDESVS